jgi:hypothetical protein
MRIVYRKDTWEIEYAYSPHLPTASKSSARGNKGGGGRRSDLQTWHTFRNPRSRIEDNTRKVRMAYEIARAAYDLLYNETFP